MNTEIDQYILGRNLATITVYTGARTEKAILNLLDKGEEGQSYADLSERAQGYCAATFNMLLNQADGDEARGKIMTEITQAITPENLQWLQEHRARHKNKKA